MKLRLLRFIGAFYLFFIFSETLRDIMRYPERWQNQNFDTARWFLGHLQSSLLFLAYALFSYLFLYYYYKKISKTVVFVALTVIAFGTIGLRYVTEEVIIKAITGYGNYYEGTTVAYYIVDNLYYAMLYTAFGVCWFFVHYAVVRDRQQQELLLENKKSELAFLRSQVNPHFLFNMLNNIYALINMKSDKALVATEKLSQLLRYSLYETDKLVTIENELDAVRSYIDLERLRFRESVQTTITAATNVQHIQVTPFLLMPLVENAFKHGVVTDATQPIMIKVQTDQDRLEIEVLNAVATREKDEVGGIGVENLKKRLALTYGDDAGMSTEVIDGQFIARIFIKLKP
ncbi:sensor histidine kinase [Nonlabens ponticola]|uniref:Histidine kinase n=1 Tax=Nonlabens ponticola TaxID=2496866 RepID=A0A3S9MVA4_9FLAO|nr:histidine kinase [Nonlabens ponticola]AZQ43098.1 histidine kinase [Nonlabens ponticola]